MSGPGERRRVVDLYSATPMAAARVAERLGYPTGQCLECRPAKDPGYAGHMAKSIIPLETGTKAIVFCFNVCSTGSAVFFRSVG